MGHHIKLTLEQELKIVSRYKDEKKAPGNIRIPFGISVKRVWEILRKHGAVKPGDGLKDRRDEVGEI